MSSEWQTYLLDELCEFTNGFAFKSTDYVAASKDTIEVFRMGYICRGGGFKEDSTPVFVPRAYGKNLEKYLLKAGDVVIAMTDMKDKVAILGNTARIRHNNRFALNQRVGCIRVKRHDLLCPDFLYFYSNSLAHVDYLRSRANSGVQVNLSTSAIKESQLEIPPLAEQKKVASILMALDDRIALLRETNTTLEAIAQATFKSWFVDFDPVRAKMEGLVPEGMDEATAELFPDTFVESDLGEVPEGWKFASLADVFEINPSRKLPKGTVASYLDMASLATSGHCVESPIERETGSGAKFQNGDTLLARITPCLENGKSAFVDFLEDDQVGWGSTEFLVLRPKAPLPEYLGYLLCRHPVFRQYAIQSMSGTSGRQRIQNDVLGRYLFAVPGHEIALMFGRVVKPIQQSIAANHKTAQTLAALRDTLLPRLISGKLRLPVSGYEN